MPSQMITDNAGFENRFSRVVDFAQVMLNYHFRDSQRHFAYVRYVTKALCLRYNKTSAEPFSEADLQLIYIGATLHDIGLISIPDRLLNAKGPLTRDDRLRYESHAQTGANIIDQMTGIYHLIPHEREVLRNICLCHHERYDGSGYPNGLRGEETPLYAQIVAIAEVYDSLTAKNYSEPRTHEEAMGLILSGACGAFNPALLDCLRDASADVQVLWESRDDDDRIELLYEAMNPAKQSYWLKKRALDVAVSSLALLALSPVLALAALAVWLENPKERPICREVRVGRHNRNFEMYRFRTTDAKSAAPTRVGKLLGRTHIDGLPQLLNVLNGDMTLVGPSPALPSEAEQYSRYAEMRLSVTPGLTCLWRTERGRGGVTFDQQVDMDIAYIGTRSFAQDVRLIFRTLKVMILPSAR